MSRPSKIWNCPACGTKVNASFEVCWACGTSFDGTPDPDFVVADQIELSSPRTTGSDAAGLKPPIFLWKSGKLDVFDTVKELEDCYPLDTLAGKDFIACDSEGRILLAGRGSDGSTVITHDEHCSPAPNTLREILRGYLERSGKSPEEVDVLSLADLVAIVHSPSNPQADTTELMLFPRLLRLVAVPLVLYMTYALFRLCGWLRH